MNFEQWQNLFINRVHCADYLGLTRDWPDGCVDVIFADPPFNVGKRYGVPDSRKDYRQWCEQWIDESWRLLKETGTFYLMTLTKHLDWKLPLMAKCGVFINLIKWRNVSAVHSKSSFWPNDQPIAVYGKSENYVFNTYAETAKCQPEWERWGDYSTEYKGQLKDYWDDIPFIYAGSITHSEAILQPGTNKKVHPCQMPLKLAERPISFSSMPGDVILEPFSGLAPCCVSAKRLGRKYIGVELSQPFCRIAEKRLTAVDTSVPVDEADRGQMALPYIRK